MHLSGPLDALRRTVAFLHGSARHVRGRPSGDAYQVAALPVRVTAKGKLKVLLVSTRGVGGKLIIPRGWPMRGKADFQAAAIEAEEEAGVLGPITLDPVGAYVYRSGRKAGGNPIRVEVYRLDVKRRAATFKEKGERRLLWLSVEEATRQVGEPGLVPIIEALKAVGPRGTE